MASAIDVAFSPLRYIGLLSGLHVPPPPVLTEGLSAVATAGPHTRIGLVPTPGKRMWDYAPSAPVPVRELPQAVADDGDVAVLEYIRRRPGHRAPLELHVSERHLAVDVHHGLGDGRLYIDLVSTLYALIRGEKF